MSDIHLEFYKLKCIPYITSAAPYLALCGDIGYPFSDQYNLFLKDCSKKFKMVFLVSGNHEYYQNKHKMRSMNLVEEKIKELSLELGNVYYLQGSFVLLDEDQNLIYYGSDIIQINENSGRIKYVVAGATMWTFIPDEFRIQLSDEMNDYHKIYQENNSTRKLPNIGVSFTNDLHHGFIKWLLDLVNLISTLDSRPPIMMLSHHAPSPIMLDDPNIQKFYKKPGCAYASNLEYLLNDQSPIKIWISGHTHACLSKTVNKTSLLSNCKGYFNGLTKEFLENKTVHFSGD